MSLGFKLYNNNGNNEVINKRRKLSIGSEGSESTGEKLNESFNRLNLSGGNPSSSFQPYVKIAIPQVPQTERSLPKPPQLVLGIQKYLKLGEDLDVSDLLTKPFNDLQQIQNNLAQTQQRLHFIPFGMPANYEKLMAEAQQVLKTEIRVEEERQKRSMDDFLIEQKLLNPGQKLSKEERAAKVAAYLEKKHNRQWKQVRYPVRKNLAEYRQREQGRFTRTDKPRFNQSLIMLDKEERKMETLANSYSLFIINIIIIIQIIMSDQEILLVKIFRKYFLNAYKLIFSLDQKQADRFKEKNTYYYTQQHKDCHHEHKDDDRNCCGSFFAKVYIPEKERSALEQIVFEQLSKNNIRAKLPQILDYLQQRFNSIKKSGKKDNLQWDVETEVYILNEVMREGLQFYFLKEIRLEMQKEQYIDSKQQMLVATPQTWINKYPKIELNFLSADFMYDLMNTGWSVMNKFINNNDYCHALFKELDFLERDGRFEEVQTELQRDDKTFWLTLSQMDKDSFKNLYFISHILSALPYELNSKNKDLLVQISESYQISFFGGKDKKHKKHFDSSFDKKADTGKKFTFLYVVNPVTIEIEEQKITLQPDNIVGLMSRKIPYALYSNDGRAFLIRYFIDGPVTNIC